MTRLNATERMRRLLAVIPWVSGRGEVPLAEIAERFDYPINRLREDLTGIVPFVGVYPHTPDMLIEVTIDEDNDWVRFELSDYFAAPLRLTPEEALSLVTAGLGLLDSSIGENDVLERALARLADRFGVALGDEITVSLGGADATIVQQVMQAQAERRCVELNYYSMHRGAASLRIVEPHQVTNQRGEWYLRGYCRLAESHRTFRLDRVLDATVTDEGFDREGDGGLDVFAPSEDDRRVTLELNPEAFWVTEAFPVETVEIRGDQRVVTLVASSDIWLTRLLLRLGPAARIVGSQPELPEGFVAEAAQRILARYRADLPG